MRWKANMAAYNLKRELHSEYATYRAKKGAASCKVNVRVAQCGAAIGEKFPTSTHNTALRRQKKWKEEGKRKSETQIGRNESTNNDRKNKYPVRNGKKRVQHEDFPGGHPS